MTRPLAPNDPRTSRSRVRTGARSATRPTLTVIAWLTMMALSAAAARSVADTVRVRGKVSSTARRLEGEIVDYSGGRLQLKLSSGRIETVPAEQVLEITTERTPDHLAGLKLLRTKQSAAAADRLKDALAADQRIWMRRIILSQMIACYRAVDRWEEAAETYLLIMRSDPRSRFFGEIPLFWRPRPLTAAMRQKAGQWLEKQDLPVARLLGASWLLVGPDRARAQQVLVQLESSSDTRLAWLARAQRWRTRVLTATAADVARWEQTLDTLPSALRGGPDYAVGQALARLGQPRRAALRFLRVPMLQGDRTDLAAECLLAAGSELDKAGEHGEARIAWQRVIDLYPKHQAAALALQKLTQPSPPAASDSKE